MLEPWAKISERLRRIHPNFKPRHYQRLPAVPHCFMSKTINRTELLKRLSPAQRALLLKELQKEAAQKNGEHRITRRSEAEPIPLSFSQQGLWFVSQMDPNT